MKNFMYTETKDGYLIYDERKKHYRKPSLSEYMEIKSMTKPKRTSRTNVPYVGKTNFTDEVINSCLAADTINMLNVQ